MLVQPHPAALSGSDGRGSRSQRTAPAHPPTAQANGRRPPHTSRTGCRKTTTRPHTRHSRLDREAPASWHTLGISSGSATIPTADSNKRLFYNSVLLDHFASSVDSPAFLPAGQGNATVPTARLFTGYSSPFESVFRVLEIVCRHCRFRFVRKVRNRFVRSWHGRRK